MKLFLGKGAVTLENGGYLVQNGTDKPVFNAEFVRLQQKAEYIVTYAEIAKDKDFVGKKAVTAKEIENLVTQRLSKKAVKFVEVPVKPLMSIQDKLKVEALSFIGYQGDLSKAQKVNDFMQDFIVLNDFEQFGLFFEETEIVKLNKIYTIDEITTAIEATINLL